MAPSVNKQQILTAVGQPRHGDRYRAHWGQDESGQHDLRVREREDPGLGFDPREDGDCGIRRQSNHHRHEVAAGITAPSVLLWYAQHNDSRYQDVPTWEKNVFWIVLTDKWEKADEATASGYKDDQRRIFSGELQVNTATSGASLNIHRRCCLWLMVERASITSRIVNRTPSKALATSC